MEAPRETVRRAKQLRRALTPPEARLWTALHARPGGLKFRRQHPVGRVVLDFYCDAAKLAVEVDGLWHEWGENPQRDLRRDGWLRGRGIEVLRVPAEAVRTNLEDVIRVVLETALPRVAAGPTPPRLRRGPPRPEGEETS